MAGMRFFNVHRAWEDVLGIGLGALIALTPWIAGQVANQTVVHNALLVGFLVLTLAALEQLDLHRWEEAGEIACGLWLMASPLIFNYADCGALKDWHFALGAVVMLLAVLEFCQDWKRSDVELARHGVITSESV
jgi:hypothetical protein